MRKKQFILPFLIATKLFFAEEVMIGVFVHPPHVYRDEVTGDPYGPGVEYIKTVITDMGYTPAIILLPFQRILVYLKAGELDCTLEIARTPDREEFLYYPREPAYTMVPSLTFRITQELHEITSINDLQGMTIGYLTGADPGPFFETASTSMFDTVSGETWIKLNLAKLLLGRIDAALDQNSYSYLAEAKEQGIEHLVKTIPLPGEGVGAYVVFSKNSPKGALLVEKYNILIGTGTYNEQKMIDEFLELKKP